MKRIDDPFLSILPSIDLHGEDRVGACTKVDEFINDCIKLKEYKASIIHGKGTGALKEAIHTYLSKDKRIDEFKTDNFNDGVTIITIKK